MFIRTYTYPYTYRVNDFENSTRGKKFKKNLSGSNTNGNSNAIGYNNQVNNIRVSCINK